LLTDNQIADLISTSGTNRINTIERSGNGNRRSQYCNLLESVLLMTSRITTHVMNHSCRKNKVKN